ncbi:MAG: YggS family pyridoxal phosphate-dependent enzyme, partial [Bacteroidota bacterium]
MSVNRENYLAVRQEVQSAGARLVAVSKTKPIADIRELYDLGHRDFGENRVTELVDKYEALQKVIRWHFIGHLQRNKVKYLAPFIHLIHAVDSPRLLREIDKRGAAEGRVIPVLLQYHIAEEESKYGLNPDKAAAIFADLDRESLSGVSIVGVMGMATYTDKDEQIVEEFARLRDLYRELKQGRFAQAEDFRELSMGMSGDYPIALQHGSTLVRVGSLLFGAR